MNASTMLNRVNELPKIRKVLQELVEMVNQDEVDLLDVAQKISLEQVISARVLRMSNSAHFGRSRTIASVDEAAIRLGVQPIRTLVVASVLMSAFPKIDDFDMNLYWDDTFEIATLASVIAKGAGVDGNEAFTAGMLHNIGELMIQTLAPDEAKQIQEYIESGENPFFAQRNVLGTDAPSLGAKLAKSWKFAPQLVNAIEHHQNPNNASDGHTMAEILHLAYNVNQYWDELESEEQQQKWLSQQSEFKALSLSPNLADALNDARGKGKELAGQIT